MYYTYYIYWLKPDGSVGTSYASDPTEFYNWSGARYLKSIPYVFIEGANMWGAYLNTDDKWKSVKDWKAVSPATVPAAIRAYHLLTH